MIYWVKRTGHTAKDLFDSHLVMPVLCNVVGKWHWFGFQPKAVI